MKTQQDSLAARAASATVNRLRSINRLLKSIIKLIERLIKIASLLRVFHC